MIFTLSCIFRYLQIPNRAGTGVQYRTECHGRRGRDTGPSGKGAEQRVDLFGRDLRGLCFSGPFVRIHQRQESPKRDLAQVGWMSRLGHRLEFDEAGRAVCPESGRSYRKVNECVYEEDDI